MGQNKKLPDLDSPWVSARLDELADLEARVAALRAEVADHLKLKMAWVRGRDPERLRSDATELLAMRYLLHHNRASNEAEARRLIDAGAFGWTPKTDFKLSEARRKDLP